VRWRLSYISDINSEEHLLEGVRSSCIRLGGIPWPSGHKGEDPKHKTEWGLGKNTLLSPSTKECNYGIMNISTILYNFGQSLNSLAPQNVRIAFFCGRR
jgi:hypothetical protein